MKLIWLTLASALLAGHALAIDLSAADLIAQRCATCHGATAMGSQILGAPALATKDPWYLLTQLKKFKAGIRGGAGDANSVIMRAQAAQLADEQAMKDVLAHVQNLAHP